MTTIARRRPVERATVDEDFVILRYSNGTIVDPRMCKVGNLTPSHWRRLDAVLAPGEPNTQCLCPKDEATS